MTRSHRIPQSPPAKETGAFTSAERGEPEEDPLHHLEDKNTHKYVTHKYISITLGLQFYYTNFISIGWQKIMAILPDIQGLGGAPPTNLLRAKVTITKLLCSSLHLDTLP